MISTKSIQIHSVTQLNRNIKALLEADFRFIHVTGEISTLRKPYSGHSYFTLKDEQSQIKAVLFKGQKKYLDRPIKDGDNVVCHGRITVYEPRGDYQLIVDTVDFSGQGDLQKKFEALKTQLEQRGYFQESRKQDIPPHPKKICLVTSPTGAAIKDFLKVHTMRQSPTSIEILPVTVQGEKASSEIAKALQTINSMQYHDAIVITRGGGSLEDLWPFNEKQVAEAIYKSEIPVISAIGHQIDFTIADFCADIRAATPTSAAEILFPDTMLQKRDITRLVRRLAYALESQLTMYGHSLTANLQRLQSIKNSVETKVLQLDIAVDNLISGAHLHLLQKENRLAQQLATLKGHSPQAKLELNSLKLEHATNRLMHTIEKHLAQKKHDLARAAGLLDSMSPLAILARGYSIVQKTDQDRISVIRDSADLHEGDEIDIRFKRGKANCKVIKTET